jgi:hypothetical protein
MAMNSFVKNAMSPWTSGFQVNPTAFRPAATRRHLGAIQMAQTPAAEPALQKAERDRVLTLLNAAWDKAASVDLWRSTHPDWTVAMGDDGQTVIDMTGNMSVFLPAATRVRQALQSTDPAAWVVSTKDLNDASSWATFATGVYELTAKHTPTMPSVTPSGVGAPVTPEAAAKTDYTVPIAIGAGAILLALIAS